MAKVTLRKAREIVLSERDIPEDMATIVRPEVLSSWRRSLLSGAEVSRPELPFVGEIDTDSTLCAAADPVLSKLADRLSGLGAGVLLADRHARILRRWVSDTNILPMLDTLRSDAGFSGSEEIVGTNGIGTVAETGRPGADRGPRAPHGVDDPLRLCRRPGLPPDHPSARKASSRCPAARTPAAPCSHR